jgi:outer membrane protein TolC
MVYPAIVLALLLVAGSAFAQAPAIPKVEFDDAIQRAVTNNPTVAQAAVAIPRAEALVAQARALTRPTANASFGNTTLDSARGFAGGITQPQNQSSFSADVTVPLLNLSRWAAIPQARDQLEVAQLSTATVRRDVAVATAQAYLAVIAARRQLDVDQRALDAASAHVDYAQKRVQGGSGSRLNELRAAGAASTAASRLEGSRLAVRRAQEALGVLIVANGPADAGAEPGFDIPATVTEDEWIKARPDVQAQRATQRAAERIVRDSWRDSAGTASVSFDPQYIAPKGLFQPNGTWRLGFSFSQPIFEGGLRKAVLRGRQLQVEQTKLALSGVEIRARSEIRVAQASLTSYQLALQSAQLAATQANDVLRITTSAFEVGATTNIEVIDAQRSARDAETLAVLQEDALRRAKLDLLVAIGRFPK